MIVAKSGPLSDGSSSLGAALLKRTSSLPPFPWRISTFFASRSARSLAVRHSCSRSWDWWDNRSHSLAKDSPLTMRSPIRATRLGGIPMRTGFIRIGPASDQSTLDGGHQALPKRPLMATTAGLMSPALSDASYTIDWSRQRNVATPLLSLALGDPYLQSSWRSGWGTPFVVDVLGTTGKRRFPVHGQGPDLVLASWLGASFADLPPMSSYTDRSTPTTLPRISASSALIAE
jgi:hypothetical protein